MRVALRVSNTVERMLRFALTLCAVASFAAIGSVVAPGDAAAKTPGKTYCFLGVCHRVLTLAQTRARVGKKATVIASYYDDCKRDRFNPCGLTSSGAVFRPGAADNAASPIYPNGTKLLVFNPRNGRAAVVRIDNAGPYWGRRTLDLSRAAADKLGFRRSGVARLVVKVVKAPTRAEARYRRKRRYAPVKGYLGQFDDVRDALAAAGYAARVMASMMGPDPNWSGHAAKARPVLPVLLTPEPAPLPDQPAVAFKREIRTLARLARGRRLAAERRQKERTRRLALAEAKAKQQAEERRRIAQAAESKRLEAARKAAAAKPGPAARQRVAAARPRPAAAAPSAGNAARNGSAPRVQAQTAPSQSASQAPAGAAPAVAPKRRTVWRREIVGVAQNSS